MLDALTSRVARGSRVYMWGGEQFAKSNTWMNLILWDMMKARFGAENAFDVCVIGEYSKKSILPLITRDEKPVLIHIDDCMYSGD